MTSQLTISEFSTSSSNNEMLLFPTPHFLRFIPSGRVENSIRCFVMTRIIPPWVTIRIFRSPVPVFDSKFFIISVTKSFHLWKVAMIIDSMNCKRLHPAVKQLFSKTIICIYSKRVNTANTCRWQHRFASVLHKSHTSDKVHHHSPHLANIQICMSLPFCTRSKVFQTTIRNLFLVVVCPSYHYYNQCALECLSLDQDRLNTPKLGSWGWNRF